MAVEHAAGTPVGVRRVSIRSVSDDLIGTSSPARVDGRTAALAVAAVVAGTVVTLLRQRGAGALDTIWAEDGVIFLHQARSLGALESLFEPYAGYMHAVPRLAAMVVAALPLRSADAGFALLAALTTAATALFVFRASSSHLRPTWARLAVSAPVVLAPLGGTEILASVANLHWYLLYAAVWAVLWRAPSRWEAAASAVVVALAVMSDPFVLLLAPLVGLRLVRGRRPVDAVVVAFALAAVLQLLVVAGGGGRQADEEKGSVALVPARYAVDVAGRGLAGDRLVGEGGLSARGALVAGIVLVPLAGLALVRRDEIRRQAPLLIALLGTSAAYFAAPVAISGVSPARYGFAPSLLLLSAVVVLLADWDLAGAGPRVRTAVAATAAAFALCWVISLPSDNQRSEGPAWDASLARAASACQAGDGALVPVDLSPKGWEVDLPCGDVAASGR